MKEQNVDANIDFDGRDKDAIHVLVYSNNKAIATARMLDDGHIGRVAVLKEYRRQGFGAHAVHALVKNANKQGAKRLYLYAQVHATAFYKKLGFNICGKEFAEAGIAHIEMEYFPQKKATQR